ncbi:sensor histidine kinase [Cytophaga aurantiaca]|uniref:sensor histidine kinase n=1 Tax=Cytophaga aurantiaca TaxID=29530 RepID=UPI00036583FF|nr:HAMP domain-containing sensor histidine kinase [Cytophaga aurantiaca]
MNLKNKISFIVSLLFTGIFAISGTVVYILFADFRQEEFETRLEEKAVSTIKLLVEVEEIDQHLLKIIDQNSIHKLYNEKVLIFDSNSNLIYSSLDDTKIQWDKTDLTYLKTHKHFYRKEQEQEVFGIFYDDTNARDYYALISASDTVGKRKLKYLLYILIGTYVVFTVLCWFITTYVVQRLLLPVDVFYQTLKGINENNLNTRIPVKNKKDEIDLLANEFNQMLQRIDISYQKQKEFTAHASHELRTPIARIMSQVENKIIDTDAAGIENAYLKNILTDVNQISDLISSLLLLSKIESSTSVGNELCRIDELIFESAEKLSVVYPDIKLQLDIIHSDSEDNTLEIKGNKSLLEIAFTNLIKNAYKYSDNKTVSITITSAEHTLIASFSNTGQTVLENEQVNLFESFMRGENSKNKSGLGLGLKIVQRILAQHNAAISYQAIDSNINIFSITFPL